MRATFCIQLHWLLPELLVSCACRRCHSASNCWNAVGSLSTTCCRTCFQLARHQEPAAQQQMHDMVYRLGTCWQPVGHYTGALVSTRRYPLATCHSHSHSDGDLSHPGSAHCCDGSPGDTQPQGPTNGTHAKRTNTSMCNQGSKRVTSHWQCLPTCQN